MHEHKRAARVGVVIKIRSLLSDLVILKLIHLQQIILAHFNHLKLYFFLLSSFGNFSSPI